MPAFRSTHASSIRRDVECRATLSTNAHQPVARRSRGRISWVEAVALCIAVAAVTVIVLKERVIYGSPALAELAPLRQYGPARFSEDFEEWIVRDYFKDRRGGVFLDVGANDYKEASNTYYLETALDWSGVALDALPQFGQGYADHRPKTRFIAMFASDVSNGTVEFFVPENHLVASASKEFTDRFGTSGKAVTVPTITLNDVLDQAKVSKIDFMSMDIELAEPKALAGFDIERFKPALVCIEAHPEVRQQILSYFAKHVYVIVGRYLRADPFNLYFEPLS
jgi:FkbM family methyltransferase